MPDHDFVAGKWDYYCAKCGTDAYDATHSNSPHLKTCEFEYSRIPKVKRVQTISDLVRKGVARLKNKRTCTRRQP